MKEDSAAGISLLASALALVVTMILHPTGHQIIRIGGAMAVLSHSLGLLSIPLALFGFLTLTRRLARTPNLSLLAFITYALGAVAVMCAAIFSGFVAPAVAMELREASAAERDLLDTLFHYTGRLNQAFAGVYVVASSVAIVLWCLAILSYARWLSGYGIVICAAILLAFGSGHLRLNVHGFGAVALAQGIWTVWIAVLLLRNTFVAPEG
jgi:hypothetical protein